MEYCIQSQNNENSLISQLLTDRRVPQMAECVDCQRCPSQHLNFQKKSCSMIVVNAQENLPLSELCKMAS